VQRQLIGKPSSDGNALPLVEAIERALLDVFGDRSQVVEIVGANASNKNTSRVERG
jgi:hypothetical protein